MNKSQRHIIFNELVHRYESTIYKICLFFCGRDIEKIKDMRQDIYCRLWESLPDYKRKCNLSTWIYHITHNVARSHYRHLTYTPDLVPIDESFYQEPVEGEGDSLVEELYGLIDQLSPEEKVLIYLYLERKSIQEIGEILGISVSTVNHRIAKIKDNLSSTNKCDFY